MKAVLPPLPLASTQRRTERVYQKRTAGYKVRLRVECARGRCVPVLERRDFISGERMPRTKKSVKSRSKEKRKALKRRRLRRTKSLRKGKRGR
jgi:hypothetical protein